MASNKLLSLIFFLIALAVLGAGYVHFFILTPSFVEKPNLENPRIIEDQSLSEHQVYYLLNEIDAYKLRNHPINKEPPVIEFVVEEESLLVAILNNNFETIEEGTPDLKFFLSHSDFFEIIQSEDFQETIIKKYNNNKIEIIIISDSSTLALKGYKSIYDKISSSNELTGNIVKLNPDNFTNGVNISLLFFIALILELITKKI